MASLGNTIINGALRVNGTINGTSNKAIADESGNNIINTYETKANAITNISAENNILTITKGDSSSSNITLPSSSYDIATQTENGLMSSNDKTKLDNIARTVVSAEEPTDLIAGDVWLIEEE